MKITKNLKGEVYNTGMHYERLCIKIKKTNEKYKYWQNK